MIQSAQMPYFVKKKKRKKTKNKTIAAVFVLFSENLFKSWALAPPQVKKAKLIKHFGEFCITFQDVLRHLAAHLWTATLKDEELVLQKVNFLVSSIS